MKNIIAFRSRLTAVFLAVSAAFVNRIPADIEKVLGRGKLALLTVVVLLVANGVLQQLVEFLFENSQVVRRLFMPKTFIEGDWIQVGYYSSNNELVVIGGSYVTISYSYGKIRCEGEFFDIAGRAQGRFWSTDSNFDDLSLNYIFDGVDSSEGGLLVSSGFGRMRFESSSHFGSPQRFHAIISDPKTARMYSDFGYRSQAKSGLSTKQKWDLVRVRIESESNSPKSRGLAIENS